VVQEAREQLAETKEHKKLLDEAKRLADEL
jgi:hypothetical protein